MNNSTKPTRKNLPSNFHDLCRKAEKKLESFGYRRLLGMICNGPKTPTSSFGGCYLKWDEVKNTHVGKVWLNLFTYEAILSAETDNGFPQSID